jgi:hypothetical protein
LDPLHLCISLGPLAVYLILIGTLNLSSRPLLTTGARDTAALALAIVGFAIAGPMELFLPASAAQEYGAVVWLLLLSLYALGVSIVLMFMRPRIVIYNIGTEQLRPILADVVSELDPDARWAGDSLTLPRLGVQLFIDPFRPLRNTQLVASGPRQDYSGWRRLEHSLAPALRKTTTGANRYGVTMLLTGLLMVAVMTFLVVKYDQAMAKMLWDMLRQ